uniref:Probable branched-chain amino acid transport ATP-binding protein LivG n=1 Tax=Fervidicoccus fontis TaxID=683846 RepID=A0A7J3ZL88_9CREN
MGAIEENETPGTSGQVASTSLAVIRTEKLTKRFSGITALDNVSIEVKGRSLTMIIGPNGSGKTTLINVVSGLLKPTAGKVYYKGIDITGMPPHKINKLGLVRTFQIPQPLTNLTVLENLLVAARWNPGESVSKAFFRRLWEKHEEKLVERAFEILKMLNLDRLWDEKASNLSGGQLKLLEIGRAVMNDADTILMDEPIAGVNPRLAHEILKTVRQLLSRANLTFLIVEHRLDIALQYVDYVYAMARGRVISQGNPQEVINDPLVIESYLSG